MLVVASRVATMSSTVPVRRHGLLPGFECSAFIGWRVKLAGQSLNLPLPPPRGAHGPRGLCQNTYACSFQNLQKGSATKKSKPTPFSEHVPMANLREGWDSRHRS